MLRDFISYIILSFYLRLNKTLKTKGSAIKKDSNFSETIQGQFTKRDHEYSELLRNYVGITKLRNVLKEIHKWIFFWIVVGCCCIGMYLLYSFCKEILMQKNIDVIVTSIPLLVTAFASFLSTIIVIPKVIAKFLFDTNEDAHITDLIKHTQEHDASGRNFFTVVKRVNEAPETNNSDTNRSTNNFTPIDSDTGS